ncbi:hypothetical protein PR048_013345 [Dryococelus australis]|uniref:Reverse transcriptase RNase H-like domain-containing protein n=1 Tax=Dryococelus australis TaxID=614101 RepID=A0ABQ9HRW4_9NEOP|nr:hypothetical protein PR048_013345 [Dryococelus australis]
MPKIQRQPSLKVVSKKVLVLGHSYLECHSDHTSIERLKKKGIWKSEYNMIVKWLNIRLLPYTTEFGTINLKYSLSEESFHQLNPRRNE